MLHYCRNWLVLLLVVLVTACGGEGISLDGGSSGNDATAFEATDSDSDGSDTGGNTASRSYQISFESSSYELQGDQANPVVFTLEDDEGNALVNKMVKVSTDLGAFYPPSGQIRTDDNGQGTVYLYSGSDAGSGTLTIEYEALSPVDDDDGTPKNRVLFDSKGDQLTDIGGGYTLDIEITGTDANGLVTWAQPGLLNITVTHLDGAILANRAVNLSLSGNGELLPESVIGLDANGQATAVILPGTSAGSGAISVTLPLASGDLTSSISFATAGDGPTDAGRSDLSLTFDQDSYSVAGDSPTPVTLTVNDASGDAVVNAIAELSSTRGSLSLSSALTDANGQITVQLYAGSDAGAGQLLAKVENTAAAVNFTTAGDQTTASNNGYLLALALDVDPVSAATPGTLTATLTQDGQPVTGQLVQFSSALTGIINPTLGTATTDANGQASVTLLPGTTAGAGLASATVGIAGLSLLDSLPFVSSGDGTGHQITFEQARYTLQGDQATAVSFTLTDASGSPLANQQVSLATSLGSFYPVSATLTTDADGQATAYLYAGDTAGSGLLTVTYDGTPASVPFNSKGDQLTDIGGGYTLDIEITGTDANGLVTWAQPGLLNITVTHLDGAILTNRAVNLSLSGNGELLPESVIGLDTSGQATAMILPGTTAGSGAISVTLPLASGDLTSSISFATAGDGPTDAGRSDLAIAFDQSNYSVSGNTPTSVTLTVNDASGDAVTNAIVALSSSKGSLSQTSALTDANGQVTVQLYAGSDAGAGQLLAKVENTAAAVNFTTTGDQTAASNNGYLLELALDVAQVSAATPGTLTATLTQDGQPVAGQLVQFSSALTGIINPTLGTATTDANGQASITLLPGTTAGAGLASASVLVDSISLSDSLAFSSNGDGEITTGNNQYQLTTQVFYAEDAPNGPLLGNNIITKAKPATVVTYLTDDLGQPLTQKVVTFSSQLGEFQPSNGTALTDDDGMATIILKAGSVKGASEVKASYQGASGSTAFYTEGDDIDEVVAADFELTLYDCNDAVDAGWTRDQLDVENFCMEATSVSPDRPGILKITANSTSGAALANTLIQITSELAQIYPTLGTAITDNQGRALVDVVAGETVGSGLLTVTGITATGSKQFAFTVGAENLSLALVTVPADTTTVAAGSTLVIQAQISDSEGNLYQSPVSVDFESSCSQSGDSVLDSPVTSVGGLASSVYRAAGCEGQDLVTVTVQTGNAALSQSLTLDVEAADVGSIEFVSAEPEYIALRGTGESERPETSTVTFRVVDQQGNSKPLADVEFELSSTMGDASVTPGPVTSDADGLVRAVVTSGWISQSVRVVAKLVDGDPDNAADTQISGVSSKLIMATGLPDQNSFSISADILNPDALNYDGTAVAVSIRAADHFNNPVPDGTAIYFQTEGGMIQEQCQTADGKCSVTWESQDPRPDGNRLDIEGVIDGCALFTADSRVAPCINEGGMGYPYGGRATVLATAKGEESFADLNGNGLFDSTDTLLTDLAEAWQDDNEDGIFRTESGSQAGGANEEPRDLDFDGVWDDANGLYNGLLCSDEGQQAGSCIWNLPDAPPANLGLIEVRDSITLVMSGRSAFVRTQSGGDDTVSLDLCVDDDCITETSRRLDVYIADIYNNPMPYGTTVSFSTSNGVLSGSNSYTIGSTNRFGPSQFSAFVEPETEPNKKSSGTLAITISVPGVTEQTFFVSVSDGG